MEIIGLVVVHKTWKKGTILTNENGFITIDFPSVGTKRMMYPLAFDNFLKFEDSSAQAIFEQEKLEKIKAEEIKKAEEAAKKAAEEAAKKAAEEAASRKTEERTSTSKTTVDRRRISGIPLTYWVFQGGTFDEESSGGFIWAPKFTSAGTKLHHWDRLMELCPGDIIFHCDNGYIVAISQVLSKYIDCERPGSSFDEWNKDGRKVNCNYCVLDNPVKHSDYRNKILEYCGVKYSPFDKNGSGNLGYLFDLNKELAKFFFNKIVIQNPYIGTLDYLDFLK